MIHFKKWFLAIARAVNEFGELFPFLFIGILAILVIFAIFAGGFIALTKFHP